MLRLIMRVSLSDGRLRVSVFTDSSTEERRQDLGDSIYGLTISEVRSSNKRSSFEYTRFESPLKGYTSDVNIDLFLSKVSSQVLTYALAFCS